MIPHNQIKFNESTLRKLIHAWFNLDEIKSLCSFLKEKYSTWEQLDYEDLEGKTKEAKIRELIDFGKRRMPMRQCLYDLAREVVRKRPTNIWQQDLDLYNPYCELAVLQRFIKNNCNEEQLKTLVNILKYEIIIERDEFQGNIAVLVFEAATREPPEITALIGEIINLHPDIDWQQGLQIDSPYHLVPLVRVLINQFDDKKLSPLFTALNVDYERSVGYSQHHRVIASIFEVWYKKETLALVTPELLQEISKKVNLPLASLVHVLNKFDDTQLRQLFNKVNVEYKKLIDHSQKHKVIASIFEVWHKNEILALITQASQDYPEINWPKQLDLSETQTDELLQEVSKKANLPLAPLARVLINGFDSSRLSQLFGKLNVDYKEFIEHSPHHKVSAFIFEVWRKKEIPALITHAWQNYPDINWPEQLGLSTTQIDKWKPKISPKVPLPQEDGVQEILDCHEPSTDLFLQLQNHGFTRNPFRSTSRYAEEDSLFLCPAPNFDAFVRPSEYEEIIRGKSLLSPGTPYIFGAPGTGKTLLCHYIEYDFTQTFLTNYGFEKPILAVQHNFWSVDNTYLSIHEKSRALVDAVLQMLNKMTKLEYLGLKPERQIHHLTLMRHSDVSSYSLLEEMIHCLFDIDIGGVCILLDCSQASEQVDVERVFHSIKGLVDRYDLLTIPGLLFKFFLPMDLMNIYKDNLPIDKLKPYTIQWSKEHLQKMLISRISFCRQQEGQRPESTDMAWGSFIGLFDQKSQFELFEVSDDGQMVLKDSMLESIEFNPRQMLQLCRQKLQNRLDDVGGL